MKSFFQNLFNGGEENSKKQGKKKPNGLDYRRLRMEPLENREMLSVSPTMQVFKTDTGGGLDNYTSGSISFDIEVTGTSIVENAPAQLTLRVYDVDYNGSGNGGQPERDRVSVNGNYVGMLTGANNSWSICTFEVDSSYLVCGQNTIHIDIDVLSGGWLVECDWGELRVEVEELSFQLETETEYKIPTVGEEIKLKAKFDRDISEYTIVKTEWTVIDKKTGRTDWTHVVNGSLEDTYVAQKNPDPFVLSISGPPAYGDKIINCTITLKDANGKTITIKNDPKDKKGEITIDRLMPMEWIAHEWAYHPGSANIGGNAGFNGYIVDLKINNWTNLDAYGLVRKTSDGEIEKSLLVFRGTQEILDIVVDLNIHGVGESQYASGRSSIITWANKVSKTGTISVTGHSLGGALAQYFAADWTSRGGRIDTIETFQSGGIRQAWTQQFNISNCTKSIHHIAAGDIVSLTGSFVAGQYLVHSSFSSELDAHTRAGLAYTPYVLVPSFNNPAFSYGSYAGYLSTANVLARCDTRIQDLQRSNLLTNPLKNLRILAIDVIKNTLSNRASLEYLRSHATDLGIGGMAILLSELIKVLPLTTQPQSVASANQTSQASFSLTSTNEDAFALPDYELDSGWKVTGQTLTEEGVLSGCLTPPGGSVSFAFTLNLGQEDSVMQISGAATYPLDKNTHYAGNSIDLSGVFDPHIVGNLETSYSWKFQNGTNVAPSKVTKTENGKFAFDSSLVGQQVYCVMTNAYLDGFTLTTSIVEITSVAPQVLSAPNLNVPTSNSTSINVTWNNIVNCNSYILQYSTDANFEQMATWEVSDIVTNSCSITGLLPNTTYYVRVKAIGSDEYTDSSYSTTQSVKTAVSPVSAIVLNSNTQDNDSNGLFDALTINTRINTSVAGTYRIDGTLYSSTGEAVVSVSLLKNLANGNNTIDIVFDGSDIFYSGFDGPYVLELSVDSENEYPVFFERNLYQTATYQYTQFEGGEVTFTRMFSDHGVDLDDNGKFDMLSIDVELDVARVGEYEIIGYLQDIDGNYAGYCSVITTLDKGEQTVALDFGSIYLISGSLEKQWMLSSLIIRDVNTNTLLSFHYDVYTTSQYNIRDFQSEGVRFNGTNSEIPIDEDGDGKYNRIDVQFGVDVQVSGNYVFSTLLLDNEGNAVGYHNQTYYLENGTTDFIVQLDSYDFLSGKFNGPFHLAAISLHNDSFELAAITNPYTTRTYQYTDFDSPSVVLGENIEDHLEMTQDVKQPKLLCVSLEIFVENTGYYNVNARLVDGDGSEIGWASTNPSLTAGEYNTVELLFTGEEILSHGVPGPYFVKDLSIYAISGSSGDSLFLLDVHETAAYSLNDFASKAIPLIALGSDAGPFSKPIVQVYDASTDEFLFEITADRTFGIDYTGGVRVATGDLNGDGVPDIAVVPGRSMAPSVLVFDGKDGSLMTDYCIPAAATYGQSFKDGLNVAIGDVLGNGMNDIILVPSGGQAVVKVFENITDTASGQRGFSNQVARQFNAFEDYKQFIGGGSVAVGNTEESVDAGVKEQIVIGTGPGIDPIVRVFDVETVQPAYNTVREIKSNPDYIGGVNVALGDLNGDGVNELVISTKNGGRSWVDIIMLYPEACEEFASRFQVFDGGEGNNVAVNVALRDIDGDGLLEILATQSAKGKAGYTVRKIRLYANNFSPQIVDEIIANWPNELASGLYIG